MAKRGDKTVDLEHENAELRRQLAESLAQQQATAEVIQVINSSPSNLKPVFDAILERAHHLCGADFGSLVSYDGEFLRSAAERNLPPAWADFVRGPMPLGGPDHPATRLMHGEPLLHIEDLAELARTATDPMPSAGVELAGIRTLLLIPLRKGSAFLGYITAFRQEVRPFTEKQIALLQNFAAQAVIAIENARLLTETREALDQQTATAEVLGVINASPGDLAPVFEAMLERAVRLCEADTGHLFRFENGAFFRLASNGVSEDFDELFPLDSPVPMNPASLPARMIATRSVLHVRDQREDESYRLHLDRDVVAAVEHGILTVLFVPLIKEGEVVGHFTMHRTEVRPFSERQIALLRNFAAQAVIAIENARLLTETREALDQQTATAEVLQVINSSPGDLTPVFETMLDKALQLCNANYGYLLTYDGEGLAPVADRGNPAFSAWVRERGKIVPEPGTINARIIGGEAVVQVADVINDPFYQSDTAMRRAVVEIGGFRTVLTVALRKDDVLLGVIHVYRQEVRPFSNRQIALLENFAAQAVIAMENARLITETREALEQQTATAEVLQVINVSPGDLMPVFEAILDKAHALCGAERGTLFLYDGEKMKAAVAHGYPADVVEHLRAGVEVPPRHAPLFSGNHVHIPDLTKVADHATGHVVSGRGGVRTNLLVPLFRNGALLGMISCNRTEVRPFSDKEIALIENFAQQAVIAIENARLLTETREALEQQTATAEVLGVINASPGKLAPVFDAMLERALRLCEAVLGVLFTYDGEYFHLAAHRGFPPGSELLEMGRDRPQPGPDTGFGRIVRGERLVHIVDITDTDAYRNNDPIRRATADVLGARTSIFVALVKDDVLLGGMHAYRREVRPFTDKQIALLQNFAAQAVIAMENARLITETQEALDQQTATAEVLGVINSSPGNLVPVFEAMLDKALALCDAAYGGLWTYDGTRLRFGAGRGGDIGLSEELLRNGYIITPDAADTAGRLLRGEPLVHIADVSQGIDPESANEMRRALLRAGGRSLLAVPLWKDSTFLGYFGIFRREVRPFTDKQIALLENFAVQAVIAMENARLITETREALDQQTATAEVLQVINSSPGDLAPVFDVMVERAARLCEADEAAARTFDGELLHLAATHGTDAVALAQLRELGPTPLSGLYAPFANGEEVVHYVDARETDTYRRGLSGRNRIDARGIRTWLAAALRKEGKLLGVINVHRRNVRPFTDKQIALLQNFAAQAVIAMENARLLTETREALEQQTATAEVLQVINASPGELQPVFDIILEKAMALCDVSEGDLELYDGNTFRAVATLGLTVAFAEQVRRGYPASDNPATRPLIAGERFSHIVNMADADFSKVFTHEPVKDEGHHTLLCVPLRREGRLLGMIASARKEVRPFSEKEIALLENFAQQAVIAMENARLLGELRQRTEEVAELNRGLEARVAEQVDELGRVGRLKRFLAPQLAELIVSQGDENILESHRREIIVVFCDLRGYTAFTETAEPEEVLDFLREYHGALGPLVAQFEGTLDQFSGDGIMVFFNDPVPIPDPAARAVEMAMAMREAAGALTAVWRRRGRELGFGAGIAQGYATLGQIGFSERSGYTAIGTVCSVAARLCAEAKDGQILIAQRVAAGLNGDIALEEMCPLPLKGITQPVVAFNVAASGTGAGRLRLVEP